MNELIVISHNDNKSQQVISLTKMLKEKGFKVWNDTLSTPGFFGWSSKIEKIISSCNVLITMLSGSEKPSDWMREEMTYAKQHNVTVIPLLDDEYSTQFEKLLINLQAIFKSTPPSKYQLLQLRLNRIMSQIPDLEWTHIVSYDGMSHLFHLIDAVNVERMQENRRGALSIMSANVLDRASYELQMGDMRFTISSGTNACYFCFTFGGDMGWVLSFKVKGRPSIDKIVMVIENSNFVAEITPLL